MLKTNLFFFSFQNEGKEAPTTSNICIIKAKHFEEKNKYVVIYALHDSLLGMNKK